MRALFLYLLLATYPVLLPAQADSLGFTNKAEAKNMVINGKKEGKWVEYTNNTNDNFTSDTNSLYYRLTIYNNAKPVGLQRGYYKSGKPYYLLYYLPNPNNTPWPDIQKQYYEDGKLMAENTYSVKNGKPIETKTGYYEDGKIKWQTICTDKGWSKTKFYDESGKEIKQ